MEHIKQYDLDIQTITPVHIGSGDTYLASECLPSSSGYDRINLSRYFMNLNKEQQDNFLKNLVDNKMLLENIEGDYVKYSISKEFEDDFKSDNMIYENIKVFNQPYIPGSSIKGSIRNALLYNSFKEEDINKILIDGKVNEKLFKSYFAIEDTNNDILRFLTIKDSSTIDKPLLYKVFNTKPKAKGSFEKGIPMYMEAIYLLKETLHSSLITSYDDNKFNTLNFDSNKIQMLDVDYIKKSIFNFSNDLISHEIKFCKENKLKDLKRFYEGLKNDKDSPVLKLGHGSGFLATTISLKIKNNNEQLYDEIKELVVENKKGDKKEENKDFPITRSIIRKGVEKPLGWVRLSFEER